MGELGLEKAMEVSFQHLVEKLLIAEIRSERGLAEQYYRLPLEKQREIDLEIRNRSRAIGEDIARTLEREGYLKKEPDGRTLSRVVRQALRNHGGLE